jgi:DtxR family transcriptional regulator, Mn-dependent transcriptional regulator
MSAHPHPVGQAAQDYLKLIWHLQGASGATTTMAVARAMGVAGPSVTAMTKKLTESRLVRHDRYHGISLTPDGEKAALEVIRHHRLLELYLSRTLGYGLSQVHEEAERLEHVISEQFEERIDAALGRPRFDPHGHPIPDAKGRIARRTLHPLSGLAAGGSAVVRLVASRDPEKLAYLESLGILPGARIAMLERKPFGGPLEVAVGARRRRASIGEELAAEIMVAAGGGDT